MKTSEAYLSGTSEFSTAGIDTIDTFSLMRETSQRLVNDLSAIYDAVDGATHGLTFALYGSPARYEMLPLSDIDLLILRDSNDTSAIAATESSIRNIRALPYDKIDIPRTIVDPVEVMLVANSNSPDGHVAKAMIVRSPDNSTASNILCRAAEVLQDPKLQLEGLIFDYHFLSHRARTKSQSGGVNLKYSEGGTRDMVYFDWAADYITSSEASRLSHRLRLPQIEMSLPVVCQYLDNRIDLQRLKDATHVINTVKHNALLLAKDGGYFDGLMSEQTAHQLSEHFWEGSISSDMLMHLHTEARKIVSETKDQLYYAFRTELNNYPDDSDTFFTYLKLIDRVWSNDAKLNRQAAMQVLSERSRWVDVATVLGQPDVTNAQIDAIVDQVAEQPGYLHALRMAATHPNTSDDTLMKLLSLPRLASDDDIDIRYRGVVQKRLGLS